MVNDRKVYISCFLVVFMSYTDIVAAYEGSKYLAGAVPLKVASVVGLALVVGSCYTAPVVQQRRQLDPATEARMRALFGSPSVRRGVDSSGRRSREDRDRESDVSMSLKMINKAMNGDLPGALLEFRDE